MEDSRLSYTESSVWLFQPSKTLEIQEHGPGASPNLRPPLTSPTCQEPKADHHLKYRDPGDGHGIPDERVGNPANTADEQSGKSSSRHRTTAQSTSPSKRHRTPERRGGGQEVRTDNRIRPHQSQHRSANVVPRLRRPSSPPL